MDPDQIQVDVHKAEDGKREEKKEKKGDTDNVLPPPPPSLHMGELEKNPQILIDATQRRRIEKTALTKAFNAFTKALESPQDRTEVETRFEVVIDKFEQLRSTQRSIMSLRPDPEDDIDEYEYKAKKATVLYKNWVTDQLPKDDFRLGASATSIAAESLPGVEGVQKLATQMAAINFDIRKEVDLAFSGDPMDWPRFKQQWSAVLLKQRAADKTDGEILGNLKMILKGPPRDLVVTLDNTKENLSSSWALLKDLYDDQDFFAKKVFEKLIQVPKMEDSEANTHLAIKINAVWVW